MTSDTTMLTRRALTATTLGAGFALAVQPVAASTITTDATGLTEGAISIPVRDGQMPGYQARPANITNAPVILVIHEIFGVHAWIKDICRRFAKKGYLAVAPDMFFRAGDATQYTDIQALIRDIVFKTSDESVMADMDATAQWSRANGGSDSKLGVTGFCWGGRTTWLYAAHNPAVKAGVAWYGGLVKKERDPRPLQPVAVADKIKGRVLGLYASDDSGIPLADVEAMKAALKAAGDTQSDIIVYQGAQHGFLADYRQSYNAVAAQAGWAKALEWFGARGVT